jgi:integrase
VAERFSDLDFRNQTVEVRRGRSPRRAGMEATPKTGGRVVECSFNPEIFKAYERQRRRSLKVGKRDFVFTDEQGNTLNQEWLHKRVWLPTLRTCGLRERGQYQIRSTFISLALSAGEDPGWIADVCGTSERMIWEHYRRWMPAKNNGRGIAKALSASLFVTKTVTKLVSEEGNPTLSRG